ncbi:programmed cell death protein 2-like protein [Mollivirus sibericum]|uniref:programmed cell death protein 2-like protein n=1 Tax=Mollivirus sibericum TaxID=1678078 RepID=UPI0006B2E9DF|nr:programmed cell death protein 2-like protein [Mollivirus sibericum]ALD62126.1 programmed cell death protein 2-like protein [Mollivirus sibericum]
MQVSTSFNRPMQGLPPCWVCGSPTTKKCGRCLTANYCSRPCQLADWKEKHRRDCTEATKSRPKADADTKDKRRRERNKATATETMASFLDMWGLAYVGRPARVDDPLFESQMLH